MISRDQILESSKRLAIDEFTVMREYLQIVFLSILYSTNESQKIYFKGGTAIRLLMKAGRFSEDLDFTADLTASEIEQVVANSIRQMSLVVPNLSLKRTEESKFSYTGILNYHPDGIKYPLTIHLEFSFREKPETSTETVLETEFPIALQSVVRHIGWPEVLAEKIRAFLQRLKGRDMYDIWFMLSKGTELDWDMINRKLKFYDMSTSLPDLINRIDDFEDKKLKDDLLKFLPVHDRNLVAYLKQMTLEQLKNRASFTIASSGNIDYTKVPSHSYSGRDKILTSYESVKTARIRNIKRRDENSITIDLIIDGGLEATAHVRSRNLNGVRELDLIMTNAASIDNVSYDDLINHEFES